MENIRNFSIIAHIDHGKSTLADRMLEITGTVEKRKMKEQILDNMELERERGITIKMQPVRMEYKHSGKDYILNLIDTPGHIDFSYEVSRAQKAVEGAILLVDGTQGVQAQTLTTLGMAQEAGLKIIPAISKIDSPLADIEKVKKEIIETIHCDESDIVMVSGKTGEGVEQLLNEVIEKIPAPHHTTTVADELKGLIFDFGYSNHRGVIVYVRVFDGKIKAGDNLKFCMGNKVFNVLEVGVFRPQEVKKDFLSTGEIGYIVTGIKEPGIASVGDTLVFAKSNTLPLGGYLKPIPVVWASIYPNNQDNFMKLSQALDRLRLSDSSFTYEMESSGILGRGFRCGFLGMLHLEIVTERLKREFGLELVVTTPSINYRIKYKTKNDQPAKEEIVYTPFNFPNDGTFDEVIEPWVNVSIILPHSEMSQIMQILFNHEAEIGHTENFGSDRTKLDAKLPLRELMRNFFDEVKSASRGYASISYSLAEDRQAFVTRLDVLVNGEVIPAFSRVVARRIAEEEGQRAVERLVKSMPRQQIEIKIQAYGLGRILASDRLSAFRKDVLMHGSKMVGGGDVSRKKKLLEKQKKGKKKMQSSGKINIPEEVFVNMIKNT